MRDLSVPTIGAVHAANDNDASVDLTSSPVRECGSLEEAREQFLRVLEIPSGWSPIGDEDIDAYVSNCYKKGAAQETFDHPYFNAPNMTCTLWIGASLSSLIIHSWYQLIYKVYILFASGLLANDDRVVACQHKIVLLHIGKNSPNLGRKTPSGFRSLTFIQFSTEHKRLHEFILSVAYFMQTLSSAKMARTPRTCAHA